MIIDIRCRLSTKKMGKYFYERVKAAGKLDQIPALKEGTIEAFFRDLKEAGVTTAVSASGNNPGKNVGNRVRPARTTSNDEMAAIQKKHYGRIIGVAGIDAGGIFHNPLEELERCVKKLGLKVACIEPSRSPDCPLNDKNLYPLYHKCSDMGVPVIIQTNCMGAEKLDYMHPDRVDEVAADFPKLNIICGHGCYPWVREMIIVAGRRNNVFPSPDSHAINGLGTDLWVEAVNRNLYGMANKFIFGTAYPLYPLKHMVDAYFQLPWKKEVLPQIMYKNALRALKLENDLVFKKMYKV